MTESLKELVERVVSEKIRPGLRFDGGDIEIVDVQSDGTVQVRLKGQCASCPFSTMTLASRVERVLKEASLQIRRVEAVS